ncbi:MAG: hypothetical protein GQ570_07490 [Helicobacteraceae bacterium]|nr:hypothetical protein [Helicobacteraceae bacterium]
MKFSISKKLHENRAMKLLLSVYTIFILTFITVNIFMKVEYFGSTLESVKSTILGNEEEFIDPMSLEDILTIVHTDLFSQLFILVTIASLYMRTPILQSVKMGVLGVATVAIFVEVFSFFTLYYGIDSLVFYLVSSFLLFNISMVIMSVHSIALLWMRRY